MIKIMNNNLLDGLQALFSNNSKTPVSEADKALIENVMSRYETEAVKAPVEDTPVIEETVLEEVVKDEAPENNEPVLETKVETEQVNTEDNSVEANIVTEEANEIVEIKAEQEYISKTDMNKMMNDFKNEILAALQGGTVIPEEKIEKEIPQPVGLTKGDPSRHITQKPSGSISKYMG